MTSVLPLLGVEAPCITVDWSRSSEPIPFCLDFLGVKLKIREQERSREQVYGVLVVNCEYRGVYKGRMMRDNSIKTHKNTTNVRQLPRHPEILRVRRPANHKCLPLSISWLSPGLLAVGFLLPLRFIG